MIKQVVFGAVCLGVALQFFGCATAPRPAHQLEWLTDLPAAEAKAKAQGKLVFVDFQGSDWCSPCILMHRELFPTPQFVAYAKTNLVLVDVDFPENKDLPPAQKKANDALSDQYKVDGVPTMLLLDATGKELGRLEYIPFEAPKDFVVRLAKLKQSS